MAPAMSSSPLRYMRGRRNPAIRARQTEPAMNSPRAGRAGITVQRTRKRSGS
ncbi:hypothetical protein STRTUCAR8_05001 [Streptomyces turgidiscabies Car8]|uniref:Uncharacterized protein n=1 Tax=Streptomyces turgidiscabies (strain Car8) TaxID=698760 RepID=L7F0C5_STRT8|nr:hypothetical protein STRTUCAR8_05001 [Streptomyces turgidiscabies Car8]